MVQSAGRRVYSCRNASMGSHASRATHRDVRCQQRYRDHRRRGEGDGQGVVEWQGDAKTLVQAVNPLDKLRRSWMKRVTPLIRFRPCCRSGTPCAACYEPPGSFEARYRLRARALKSGFDRWIVSSCILPSSLSGVMLSAYW